MAKIFNFQKLKFYFLIFFIFLFVTTFGSFCLFNYSSKNDVKAITYTTEVTFGDKISFASFSDAVSYINSVGGTENSFVITLLANDGTNGVFNNKLNKITILSKGTNAYSLTGKITNNGNNINFSNINLNEYIGGENSSLNMTSGKITKYTGYNNSVVNFSKGEITTVNLNANSNFIGTSGQVTTINASGEESGVYIGESCDITTINLAAQAKIFVETNITDENINVSVDDGLNYAESNPIISNEGQQEISALLDIFDITVPLGFKVYSDTTTIYLVESELQGSVSISGTNIYGETLTANVTNTDNADLTYQWFANDTNSTNSGTVINGATEDTYTVGQGLVGKYIYLEVTASKEGYDDIVWSGLANGTVQKRPINNEISLAGTYVYNGRLQSANIQNFDSNTMYISNNDQTNAGTYTIVVRLKDTDNYEWSDGTTVNIEIDWTISPKEVSVVWDTTTSWKYDGNSHIPSVLTPLDGERGEIINIEVAEEQTEVGNYTATASISSVVGGRQNKNNYLLTNTTCDFSITANALTKPTLSGTYTYNGELQIANIQNFDANIMNIVNNEQTDAGTYNIVVSLKEEYYKWSDNSTDDIELSWTISPKEVSVVWDTTTSWIYDGNSHKPSVISPIDGEGGEKINLIVTGEQTEIGNYTATASISSVASGQENVNNYTLTNTTCDFSITIGAFTKPTLSGTYTYNGELQIANIQNFDANIMNIVNNEQTDAGTYNIIVSLKNKDNYEWSDGTTNNIEIDWTISPKEVAVVWTNNIPYTYNGTQQNPTAQTNSADAIYGETINLSINFTQNGITVVDTINVGEYVANASISSVAGGQEKLSNYVLTNLTENYSIEKAKLSTPANLSWNVGVVSWIPSNEVNGIEISYNIQLYKDGEILGTTKEVADTPYQYDFTSEIKTSGAGVYTFKVTAISSNVSNCESSDEASSDEQYASNINITAQTGLSAKIADASSYLIINSENNVEIFAIENKGYTFTSWNTSSTNLIIENNFAKNTKISYSSSVSEDIIITANSSTNSFDILFDANEGEGIMDSLTITYDESFAIPTNTFTREGYTFDGWSTTENGNIEFDDEQNLSKDDVNSLYERFNGQDITFYAVWKINSYTIVFDSNGGENCADLVADFDEEISLPVLSRNGYNFEGWFDDEIDNNGTGSQIQWIKMPALSQNSITLYAKWTEKGDTPYKVEHYQMNLDGESFTLIDTDNLTGVSNGTITPNVKTYIGFTAPSTQTTTIDPNGTTIVRYEYTRNKHQFTLNAVEGVDLSQSTQSGNIFYGETVTLKAIVLDGYTWEKWNNDETESDTSFVMPNEEVIISAIVTKNTYTITYDLNGGEVDGTNPTEYTVTDEITLLNPTKIGYDFDGWTGSNGSTPEKSFKILVGSYGDKQFVANWLPSTNTIYKVYHYHMDTNGESYTLIVNDIQELTGTTDDYVSPSVNNYEGFTSPNTQTVQIKADGSTIVEYYYTRNTYQVTWNDYDNSRLSTTTEYYGVFPTYDRETPTRASDSQYNYEFLNWSPNLSAVTGNVTYTAQYRNILKTYQYIVSVTYNATNIPSISVYANDQTGTLNEHNNSVAFTFDYGTTISLYAEIEDNQYSYNLVLNASNISTNKITSINGNTISINSDVTVNLIVTQIFSITAQANDDQMGSITSLDNVKVLYGNLSTYNFEANAERGYNFVGWTNENNAFYINRENELTTTISNIVGDGILVANFEIETYKIVLQIDTKTEIIEYDINTDDFTLPEPQKERYQFNGWIENAGDDPQKDVVIRKGSVGDRQFYAVFIQVENNYILIIIIAASAITVGLITTLFIVIRKKKKKTNKRKAIIFNRPKF